MSKRRAIVMAALLVLAFAVLVVSSLEPRADGQPGYGGEAHCKWLMPC